MTVDAPFAASRLLVVARILAAVFACSCAKPECTSTLDGTPGKSVLSKAVWTMLMSVRSAKLFYATYSQKGLRYPSDCHLQLSRVCSFVGDDDRLLTRPVPDEI